MGGLSEIGGDTGGTGDMSMSSPHPSACGSWIDRGELLRKIVEEFPDMRGEDYRSATGAVIRLSSPPRVCTRCAVLPPQSAAAVEAVQLAMQARRLLSELVRRNLVRMRTDAGVVPVRRVSIAREDGKPTLVVS